MDKNEIVNQLEFIGYRLQSVVLSYIENDLEEYAIKEIDDAIYKLSEIRYEQCKNDRKNKWKREIE